jgi:hypothetical protein
MVFGVCSLRFSVSSFIIRIAVSGITAKREDGSLFQSGLLPSYLKGDHGVVQASCLQIKFWSSASILDNISAGE